MAANSDDRLVSTLKQTHLGRSLSDEEIDRIAKAGTITEIAPTTVAIREGEPSDSLLVLLSGEVEILKGDLAANPHQIRTLGKGEVIGELGLILHAPRSCSVRATQPTQIFKLHRQAFEEMLDRGDSAASHLAVQLARIMGRRANQLTDEAVEMLDENDRLLETVDRLKTSSSSQETERLRQNLYEQAAQLRQKQQQFKRKLHQLNAQIDRSKVAGLGLQAIVGCAAGAAVVLGMFIALDASDRRPPSPAIVPFVETEAACTESGRFWCNGECLDFQHDPNF